MHRWRARRRELGTLSDLAPGGAPVHAVLADEVAEILAVAQEWGPVDRSHRKLAHRGCDVGRVWVAPFDVSARSGCPRACAARTAADTTAAPHAVAPLAGLPNRTGSGVWDVTHFGRARRCVFAIVEVVSRYWTATLVSTAQTSTQVRVVFDQALGAQDLDELLTEGRLDLDIDDPDRPILLAVSDNGPAMTSPHTRAYMAMTAIAQHPRRPHTPTDQAWIESFFSHITHEWPHLDEITDPALLDTELARIRIDYNEVRRHEALGYVTPHDEHHQQGEPIREARRQGIQRARTRRLHHNRRTTNNNPENTP